MRLLRSFNEYGPKLNEPERFKSNSNIVVHLLTATNASCGFGFFLLLVVYARRDGEGLPDRGCHKVHVRIGRTSQPSQCYLEGLSIRHR